MLFDVHKERLAVPYTEPPSPLQTVDIWLPRPLVESDPRVAVWIIYVHGGAWRDPEQTSRTIVPTLRHFFKLAKDVDKSSPSSPTNFSSTIPHIAGIASINYRLSPYPNHPVHPSRPDDSSRNVKHPTHVRDVAHALEYLGRKDGVGKDRDRMKAYRWIGVGHSCGATLLCQVVSGIGLSSPLSIARPTGLVLLEGIYNISTFLCKHEAESEYRRIVNGAFDIGEVDMVSPALKPYDDKNWPEGNLVLVGHSDEDTLVESEQRDIMVHILKTQGWKEGSTPHRQLLVKHLNGDHDHMWQDGLQVAECIRDVVKGICGN